MATITLFQIITVLIQDTILNQSLQLFSDSLGIPPHQFPQIIRNYLVGVKPIYDVYREILLIWCSKQGGRAKLSVLIAHLNSIRYQDVAENLLSLLPSGQDARVDTFSDGDYQNTRALGNISQSIRVVDVSDNKFKIYLETLADIFNKARDRSVVILSLNGNTRTGKSFRLNQFLKYLKSVSENAAGPWINNTLEASFPYAGGNDPVTSGIYVWSDPINVTVGREEIAIFLMDCQGLHDPRTSMGMNSKIFAFSMMLSSVFAFLDKKVTADVVEFVKLFSGIAQSLKTSEEGSLLQKFVCIVPDSPLGSFKHGFYQRLTEDTTGQEGNYVDWLFKNNKSFDELMNTISCSFEAYLMPRPRPVPDQHVHPSGWDPMFRDHVIGMVQRVLGHSEMPKCKKRLGSQIFNGASLVDYLRIVAESFSLPGNFPDMERLQASSANYHGQYLLRKSLDFYCSKMQVILQSNPDGMESGEFLVEHLQWREECLDLFENSKIPLIENLWDSFLNKLRSDVEHKWEDFNHENKTRIQRAQRRYELRQAAEDAIGQRVQFDEERRTYDDVADRSRDLVRELTAKDHALKREELSAARTAVAHHEHYLKLFESGEGVDRAQFEYRDIVSQEEEENLVGTKRMKPVYGTRFNEAQYNLAVNIAKQAANSSRDALRVARERLQKAEEACRGFE